MMLASAFMAVYLKPAPQGLNESAKFNLETIVPKEFAGWTVDPDQLPIPLTPELKAVIDKTYDQTLERTYRDAQGRRVMLSMAYTGHSEKGIQTHRPDICYPAQGFAITQDSETVKLQTPAGAIEATRLVASRPHRNEPITYWVVVGGMQARFGFQMRWRQIRSGLMGIIPESLLIRVSTIGVDASTEFGIQYQFVNDMIANLSPSNRSKILGVEFDELN